MKAEGTVEGVNLQSEGGFDLVTVKLKTQDGLYELTFWNEYMCLGSNGKRIVTFPDLIAILDLTTGSPIPSADHRQGSIVAVLQVPQHNLKLGAGVKDEEVFKELEKVIKKDIISYTFSGRQSLC